MSSVQGPARTDYLGKDGYTWWVGEVENINDPLQLGRVRVRILGWYTGHKEKQAYLTDLPSEILPWATVLLPCDKAQTKGTGSTSELQCGAWVIGFFLDGEEAQLPCVLGAFRGMQYKEDDAKRTTIADGENAELNKTNTPFQQDMQNKLNMSGNSFVKDQSSTPGSETGATEEARGAISVGEKTLPGNVVTNPIKPPVIAEGIADGVAGPAGNGFATDLERMLTELGEMTATLASSPGGFISVVTGNKIAGDKVQQHLGRITNFLSGGIAGILAPLKELLAKLIAEIVGMLVKIISQFVPIVVITTVMKFLEQIFKIFCMDTPMWFGLVQAALSDTANFANQMASLAMNKVTEALAGLDSAVKGVTNRILGGITAAMNRVRDVAGDVIAAVNAAKGMAAAARKLGETVKMIFEFDFTSLNWGSLIQILIAILGLLFKKSCNRKIKRPKSKAWYPLIGTTECDNIHDALVGTPYQNIDHLYDGSAADTGKGSFIDRMFENINPYLMHAQTFLNGAKIINDATPGKEKRIVSGPGGVSTFEDGFGNIHENVPNNRTAIIAKDLAQTIKGNYALTVEGDFYIKVMGNIHEEVTGAKNEHSSQGPQSESSGSTESPNLDTTGGATSDVDTNVTGENTGGYTVVADASSLSGGASSDDTGSADMYRHQRDIDRTELLRLNNLGGFYPVEDIPFAPGADFMGRTPTGPQLSAELKDDKEQKSAQRKEGDHDIAYTGEVKIQGAKVSIAAIESLMINSQNVKIEGNTIENIADGEIVNQANWITSFLNAGRFEFIGLFNPFAALTGQFTIVKGSIIDITCDLPFPSVAPPSHVRIAIGTMVPASQVDIIAGSTAGAHAEFIAAPTGVIGEFVPQGSIVNQVVTGLSSYSVAAGYMATGCGFGPHQVYGLPLLLN
mgnify:CR=1 FL=1|tara:strand:+ start:17694 stop:20417 length:2724 start_codon:yes stop_codon:yes gene_type:complete